MSPVLPDSLPHPTDTHLSLQAGGGQGRGFAAGAQSAVSSVGIVRLWGQQARSLSWPLLGCHTARPDLLGSVPPSSWGPSRDLIPDAPPGGSCYFPKGDCYTADC